MVNSCNECGAHDLAEEDFTKQSSTSDLDDASSDNCDSCTQFYQWKKNDTGYI